MLERFRFWGAALGVSLTVAASQAACGGNTGTATTGHGGESAASTGTKSGSSGTAGSGTGGDGAGGSIFVGSSGSSGAGGTIQGFDVEPTPLQVLTVTTGQPVPTVAYTATLDGAPINAGWSVNRGNIGTIPTAPASSATFTPTGTTGGLVNVVAGLNDKTLSRQIFVKLVASQNGPTLGNAAEMAQIPASVAALKAGGGVGGVGGEGLGVPVGDVALLGALATPSGDGSEQGLALLYPYDKTVWPRGMLAPLLMWSWTTNDADAIQIELSTTSGSFTWKGTFGRPDILAQTGKPFVRHPIPQDVWDSATNSAGGVTNNMPDRITVKLTVAKGTMAYGPITQTWSVAPARLTGTVYYNSYGTQLVKNWASLDQAGHSVGAAILGVRSGDLGPTLVVGKNSPTNAQGNPIDNSGCRVCHTVASRGRWLLTQSEQGSPGDGRSFLYDLTSADVQASVAQIPQEGVFGWAAMVGDGTFALTNTINPSSSNPAIGVGTSSFWSFGAVPTAAAFSGLPANLAAGYPSYSPDDKQIVYVDATGSTGDVKGPIVGGNYDAASHTFANLQTLATPVSGRRLGYPVFLPDNSAVVFETQVRSSKTDSVVVTRNGARSELWWVNSAGTPMSVPLDTLNGKAGGSLSIPMGPNNHGASTANDPQSSYDETGLDDSTLNYEPTVLPIVSGGYAWVVFTSRRMYGNQLTAVPWLSWPPSYDTQNLDQGTVKKLWVAAINLNAPPGTDPSHPAFYLPAQEILAGNSRGFWVLDPCKGDGTSCESGDQCCNGFCEPSTTDGSLVCTNTPPNGHCSALQEKCSVAADCCDPAAVCINGFCALKGIN